MPNSRVLHFVARRSLLDEIRTKLFDSPQRCVVLQGMGGAGKTQLALESCHRAQQDGTFMLFLWIDAFSPKSVMSSFKLAASKLSVSINQVVEGEIVLRHMKDKLQILNDPFLIVFDNYDNPGSFRTHGIHHYIPICSKCHVLFTSRHTDTGRLGHVINVSGMSGDESAELLLRRQPLNGDERKAARSIASLLGYLALALDQAAAYIKARCLDLREFEPEYQKRKQLILTEIPDEWEYRRHIGDQEKETCLSVFTTWELSLRQFESS